jgi:hypothetical protein
MSPDQSTLIAQIVFITVIVIPSITVTGVGVIIAIKVLPVMLRQAQQLIDNNTKLTRIAEQNETALNANTAELVRQTIAIEKQTETVQTQSADFKSYQSLVNDGLTNYGIQIEANTAAIATLHMMLNNLPALIVSAIQDKLTCDKVLVEVQSLRTEVSKAVQQQVRSTGTTPAVTPPLSTGGSTP